MTFTDPDNDANDWFVVLDRIEKQFGNFVSDFFATFDSTGIIIPVSFVACLTGNACPGTCIQVCRVTMTWRRICIGYFLQNTDHFSR